MPLQSHNSGTVDNTKEKIMIQLSYSYNNIAQVPQEPHKKLCVLYLSAGGRMGS